MVRLGDTIPKDTLKKLSQIVDSHNSKAGTGFKSTELNSKQKRLSNLENRILLESYVFAHALEIGKRDPKTESEKHFVDVCKGTVKPQTQYEEIYLKHLRIEGQKNESEQAKSIRTKERSQKKVNRINHSDQKSLDVDDNSTLLKRKQNSEAWLRMTERRQAYERASDMTNIPEYEEGVPRPGWFTDEDWKKMRAQDYADMKNRQKE